MKRRFEFRLERLRRVRHIQESVARAERVAGERAAREAEELRERARDELQRSREDLRRMLQGPVDPRRVVLMNDLLDAELLIQRRLIESARTLRTQAERMAEAHRECRGAARALDELRERARTRHGAELQREENAEQDEAARRRDQRRTAPDKGESDSRNGPGATDQTEGPHPRRAP